MPSPVDLTTVASTLVSDERGILAADESIATMSARLTAEKITPTESNRRDYRELLLTAPRLEETVSGIILCDETFRQRLSTGEPFPVGARRLGILPGIKVDTGTRPFDGAATATVTTGLDGLGERLAEYADLGAAFAKWRAVVDITDPDPGALTANAEALADYASLCQQHGIVPIVEPEVLCSGTHELSACAEVTTMALTMVFDRLQDRGVDLSGIVLKPNMLTPGLDNDDAPAPPVVIAEATLTALRHTVPSDVPGIAFLSGGHSNQAACHNLSAINQYAGDAPWHLTYSFGRALVSDALHAWAGAPGFVGVAQTRLLNNCRRASAATRRPVAV
ncbi:fructose-bisphosphate aldolase, class I [Marmoricola sp. URHA0025 HA25]